MDSLAPVRRRTTGERDGETRCQRRKQGGYPLFAIELSAGRFVDRKDIAHVTGDAINSRYIPAIVGAFCYRSSHRARLLFPLRLGEEKGPSKRRL